MAVLLTTAECQEVRAAIDITLDASNLPDNVILMDLYAGAAQRWVYATAPSVAEADGASAEFLRARRAAVYACAALIAPAVPVLTREEFGASYRYQRKEYDPTALAESLWRKATQTLAEDIDESPPVIRGGFFFTKASGRRGDVSNYRLSL